MFESLYGKEGEYRSEDYIRTTSLMKEYAVEAINELVDEMLAYPPNELSESANLIVIANRVKREIHGVTIERKDDKSSPVDTWDISYMSDRERKRKNEQ